MIRNDNHPEHDRLAQIVKSWFHLPFHSMGYVAEPRRWGTYWNNAQVYTSGFPVAELAAFLADLHAYYAGQTHPIYLYVDNPWADAELGLALRRAGWQPDAPELYLAHVGSVAPSREVPGLEIWPVLEANLGQFAATRLRAVSESEEAPDPSQLRAEITRRGQELSGTGRGMVASQWRSSGGTRSPWTSGSTTSPRGFPFGARGSPARCCASAPRTPTTGATSPS
jgi:hypothetical protein